MTLANLESGPDHLHAASKAGQSVASKERVSDVWPDWSTHLHVSELAKRAEEKKNKPLIVLREAAGAIVYSVGLVVLLMVILGALHIR